MQGSQRSEGQGRETFIPPLNAFVLCHQIPLVPQKRGILTCLVTSQTALSVAGRRACVCVCVSTLQRAGKTCSTGR